MIGGWEIVAGGSCLVVSLRTAVAVGFCRGLTIALIRQRPQKARQTKRRKFRNALKSDPLNNAPRHDVLATLHLCTLQTLRQ